MTTVFSRGKCPSFDSACACWLKIATLCEPFASKDGVGSPVSGPASSFAKKIGRSKPTRLPARNAEQKRPKAGVELLSSAASPTSVLSW